MSGSLIGDAENVATLHVDVDKLIMEINLRDSEKLCWFAAHFHGMIDIQSIANDWLQKPWF